MQQEFDNHPFWLFCLKHYQQPQNQETLLRLQDEFGLDVNMLLFMAFLQDQGITISESALDQLKLQNQALMTAIKKQRVKRKGLKGGDPLLYLQAKEQELELEKQHIDQLYKSFCRYLTSTLEQDAGIDNIEFYIDYELARDEPVLLQALTQSLRQNMK